MGNQKLKNEAQIKEEVKDEALEDRTVEKLGWGVVGIAAIISGVYWFFLHGLDISTKDPTPWGAMGDYFGGILNPVIAGAALYVLIKSFKVQNNALEITKQAQKDLLKEQKTANQLQNFETIFWQLITRKNDEWRKHTEKFPRNGFDNSIMKLMDSSTTFIKMMKEGDTAAKEIEDYVLAVIAIYEIWHKLPNEIEIKDYYKQVLIRLLTSHEKHALVFYYIITDKLLRSDAHGKIDGSISYTLNHKDTEILKDLIVEFKILSFCFTGAFCYLEYEMTHIPKEAWGEKIGYWEREFFTTYNHDANQ